jgi:ABC-type glycerol-3-phosphate transport system substrate-binding protein
MKNLFKFGFLALAITLSVAACNSNKTEEATTDTIDSVAEMTTDSLEAQIDTVDSTADAKTDSVIN